MTELIYESYYHTHFLRLEGVVKSSREVVIGVGFKDASPRVCCVGGVVPQQFRLGAGT